jgi:intein/homing endonuclease
MKQGQGKLFQCLKENEIVLKQNCSGDIGSVYISDIKVGDKLYCGNGKFAKVYEKRERIADAYKIGFAYGKSIVATSEHRFMTKSGLKQVKDMVEGDIILNIQNQDFPTYTQKIDVIKKIIELGFTEHYFIYDCEALINVCKANGIKCSPNNGIKISYALPYLDGIDYSNAYIGKDRSPYRFKAIYKVTENLMKLLGHYIGNGCSRRYTVSNRQTKMISSIEKSLLNEFPEFHYTKKLTKLLVFY